VLFQRALKCSVTDGLYERENRKHNVSVEEIEREKREERRERRERKEKRREEKRRGKREEREGERYVGKVVAYGKLHLRGRDRKDNRHKQHIDHWPQQQNQSGN